MSPQYGSSSGLARDHQKIYVPHKNSDERGEICRDR